MYRFFLCFRYLRRRPVILFSILGVTFGLFAMVVVTSVMGGFARDMRARIRGVSSHLVISRPRRFIGRYEEILQVVRRVPHVVAASPHVEGTCTLYLYGSRYRRTPSGMAQFIGVDMAREVGAPGTPGVSELGRYLLDGKPPDFALPPGFDFGAPEPDPGILVGSELFVPFRPGASVELQTVKEKPGAIVPFDAPMKRFRLAGRFKTRMVEYDAGLIYMPLRAAQQFLGIGDTASHLAVRLDDYTRAAEVKRAIQEALAAAEPLRLETRGLVVHTWEENPDKKILLDAVTVEKVVMAVVLFFIVLVAGFNIVAILALIVDLKTRDIGILRSLGATSRGIQGLFLLNGVLVGTIGAILGTGLGLAVVFFINPLEQGIDRLTGFRVFPPSIYYLDSLPTEVSYPTIGIVVAASLAVSLLFSVYPARKASRLDPVEAIRYE